MREHLTPAIVLGSKPVGEYDRLVDLYTKELGRLRARVIGGLKVASKLSPHLDVGNLVDVRLVYKNQFTVTDVLGRGRFQGVGFWRAIFFIKSLVPERNPDFRLWHEILGGLKASKVKTRNLLRILGYDPLLAECVGCGARQVAYFHTQDQSFLCSFCSQKFKINRTKLISLVT